MEYKQVIHRGIAVLKRPSVVREPYGNFFGQCIEERILAKAGSSAGSCEIASLNWRIYDPSRELIHRRSVKTPNALTRGEAVACSPVLGIAASLKAQAPS